MIGLSPEQRQFADERLTSASRTLEDLTENGRNLHPEARDAIYLARDYISIAETLIANQQTKSEP